MVTMIKLALSAGAPIFRGYLADVDCRWNVIAQSVDDRTLEERGLAVSGRDTEVCMVQGLLIRLPLSCLAIEE